MHDDLVGQASEEEGNIQESLQDGTAARIVPPHIIAIGTSAGGLDALKTFFDKVPAETRHSFVVIQHLSPDYVSMMGELLAKTTELPIYEAKDDMPVEPGCIYLIPPKRNMSIRQNRLYLTEKPPGHLLPLPIDIFFSSLAQDQGDRSIGVVLTGTGSDGTNGVRAIKEVGGVVVVQDPQDAAFDGMPRSAIRTGLVDFVLPLSELSHELLLYLEHPTHTEPAHPSIVLDEKTLTQILNQVRHVTATDFSAYKRPTLARRIERRMGVCKCNTLGAYLNYIYDNPEETHALRREFLIGVTRFFRDRQVWEVLQAEVVSRLVREKAALGHTVRLWSAGCSTGEEVYSLAILLREEMREQGVRVEVKIFATDIDKTALDIASQGIYPESILSDVSPEQISRYFVSRDEGFAVTTELRKMVVFSQHNILQDPPFGHIDLVVCRNLLIYLDQQAQERALDALHYAVVLGGGLLMGKSETVGDYRDVLQEIDRKARLYRNVEIGRRNRGRRFSRQQHSADYPQVERRYNQTRKNRFGDILNQTLLTQFELVSIYVNDRFDILEAVGPIRDYIELPDVGYSFNLINLLPSRLSVAISTAARRAKQQQSEVLYKGIELVRGEEVHVINLLVQTFQLHEHSGPACYMILLMPQAVKAVTADFVQVQGSNLSDHQVADLERELKDTRQNLQAMVEEVETSNEELQATNEELLAANEELQSANEELQSMNEELHTVNTELHEKIEDLAILNADIDNLLKSTEIGTIFLDADLRIRKYTPAIREQFKLRESDIGRPIAHFSSAFPAATDTTIMHMATQVLRTNTMQEQEVMTQEGHWFLLRVTPFDSTDMVSGVVLSFIDITARKEASLALADREHRLGAFVGALPGVAFVLDEEGCYREVFATRNRVLFTLAEELEGRTVHDVLSAETADLFMDVVQKTLERGESTDVAYPLAVPQGTRWFQGQVAPMGEMLDGKRAVVWIAYDVTARKEAEDDLIAQEVMYRTLSESIPDVIWLADTEGTFVYMNQSYQRLTGRPLGETLGMGWTEDLHPDDAPEVLAQWEEAYTSGTPYHAEVRYRTSEGTYRTFTCRGTPVRDGDGEIMQWVGVNTDITERKAAEQAIRESKEQFQLAVAAISAGIWDWKDLTSNAQWWSPRFYELLGFEDGEIEASLENYKAMLHPDDYEATFAMIEDLFAGTIPVFSREYRLRTKSEDYMWFFASAQVRRDAEGTPVRMVGSIINIDERKQAEVALKHSNKELEQFAYITSHDLQEPLRTLTSFSKRMQADYGEHLDERAQQYLHFMAEAASRMHTMINELLTYSRIGRIDERVRVDCNALITEILGDLTVRVEEQGATVEYGSLPEVVGNILELRRLFQNLISNALKFTRPEVAPHIRVSARRTHGYWEFRVADNGIGIDDKSHGKIFEIFQRLHERKQYEGTGIGLAQCEKIVHAHGGTIRVVSKVGKGSTFIFTLPASRQTQSVQPRPVASVHS